MVGLVINSVLGPRSLKLHFCLVYFLHDNQGASPLYKLSHCYIQEY